MTDYSAALSQAIQQFWQTRLQQGQKQGSKTGVKDAGNRSAVTGGAQLDGFVTVVAAILEEAGIQRSEIFTKQAVLPGYFRPTKNWDLVVVSQGELLAAIEFKSHIGPSFGNNFNNRVEEALGSATDLLTAYREGAFRPSRRPWLGWLILLEDTPKSQSPVRLTEPHFPAFEAFQDTSYAQRYTLFCERLVRERFYDAACLLLSHRETGLSGDYTEPEQEFNFKTFATSLSGHALAFSRFNSS